MSTVSTIIDLVIKKSRPKRGVSKYFMITKHKFNRNIPLKWF